MAILLTKSLFFDIPFVKLAKKNIDIYADNIVYHDITINLYAEYNNKSD